MPRYAARMRSRGWMGWLVVISQGYLIAGSLFYAATYPLGPNSENVRMNLFGLGVAALIALGLVLWARRRPVNLVILPLVLPSPLPLVLINLALAIGFTFFLVVGQGFRAGFGDVAFDAVSAGLAAAVVAILVGIWELASFRSRRPS